MDLLGPLAGVVASTGVEVLWPGELGAREIQLRAVVGTPAPAGVTEAGLTIDSLVEVRLEATIDGRPLDGRRAGDPRRRQNGRWFASGAGSCWPTLRSSNDSGAPTSAAWELARPWRPP